MITDWIIIISCLLFSAFFSGMEMAFLSANRLRIELDRKRGHFSSHIISIFIKKPSLYITTILVINNIILVIFGIYMPRQIDPILGFLKFSHFAIIFLQTLITSIIIIVTAEYLPKAIFRLVPNTSLRTFSFPVYLFYLLFYPLTRFIIWISNGIIRMINPRGEKNENELTLMFSKHDLSHLVQLEHSEEKINVLDHEIKYFRNALDFSNIKVRDCMVPRPDIVAIEQNETVETLRETFIETGYSKIVVFDGSIDHATGYVSSKDLFKKPDLINSVLIQPLIVPGTMPLNKLLQRFLKEHKSLAVVVDEFGGTSGIITIEDIIEEIFGDIEDEHDTVELVEKQLSENSFVFSAKASIEYLNEKYNLLLPESDNYDTLAGYISYEIGRIPVVSEKINLSPFHFKIIKARKNRIELIYLKKVEE